MTRDGVRVGNRTEGVAIRTAFIPNRRPASSGVRNVKKEHVPDSLKDPRSGSDTATFASNDSRPWQFHTVIISRQFPLITSPSPAVRSRT